MDVTPDPDLSPQQFGRAFKAFLDAALAAASPPPSPLLDRIAGHLGTDPAQLPVVTEEFDVFEQPNLQVALDTHLEQAMVELQEGGTLSRRILGFHQAGEPASRPATRPAERALGFPARALRPEH